MKFACCACCSHDTWRKPCTIFFDGDLKFVHNTVKEIGCLNGFVYSNGKSIANWVRVV